MTASAEREKLRQAIENANAAQRALDEAQVARAHAQNRWSASNEKVGAIEREIEEIEEAPADATDKFVTSLAAGGDVATLEKPPRLDELHTALDAEEIEVAKWRHAIDLAEQAIESRRHALDMAQHFVDGAARRVVSAEINTAAAMLCHVEGLRSQMLDAQARLAAIASAMDFHSESRRTVDAFLADSWLIDSPWRDRPAAQPVKDMFAALKADAATVLKL